MVTTYGMSKVLGLVAYDTTSGKSFLDGGMNSRRLISEQTALAIDEEVKNIVESAHEQALMILEQNRDIMETIAQQILAKEVIEGKELENLLNQVQPLPPITNEG